MNAIRQEEYVLNKGYVESRTLVSLSIPRAPNEVRYKEPIVQENINPDQAPPVGLPQRQVRRYIPGCDTLKMIITPFVFIVGTVFGALYGLLTGVVSGTLLVRDVADEFACGPLVTVLLAPIVAVCGLIVIILYPVTKGVLVGALKGGSLLCDGMWNYSSIFKKEERFCNAPMLAPMSFYRLALWLYLLAKC